MTFGVTPEGFVPKTLQDILTSLRAKQRTTIDPNWDAGDETLEGQLNATFAAEAADIWEAMDLLSDQLNPDAAENVRLDTVSSLTGTKREPATKGTVKNVQLTSSGATTWPAGTLIAQSGDETNVWSLDADVVATGAGNFFGNFTNTKTGKLEAPAGTLTVKLSSVPSWLGVTNPTDAQAGSDIEKDPDLRIRREEELRAEGGASEPAITGIIEQLNPIAIKSVRTLSNDSETTDVNGLPPHSFEVIVWDPAPSGPVANLTIGQAIWNNKAFGIQTFGNTLTAAFTKAGEAKLIFFTRPTVRQIFISADLTIDTTLFPLDGDTQVKLALKTEAEKLKPGDTVYVLKFRAACLSIAGVKDVPALRIALDTAPTLQNNLFTSVREIAALDTLNITVNHV